MNHPVFLSSDLLTTNDAINHGFFTRQGGVSWDQFGSLNCSAFSEDSETDVAENRKRIADALGCQMLYTLKQIHSNKVVVLDETTDLSCIVESDGLVTKLSNIAIGALGADCAAVLFADPVNNIIGVAHAGWQGALNGITDSVIDVMTRQGAEKQNLVAAIGPSIQQKSYEVGQALVAKFIESSPIPSEDCFAVGENGAGIYFNLPLYVEHRLRNAGVHSIDRFLEDTYSQESRFFSYRRSCHRDEALYGRHVGAICLRG